MANVPQVQIKFLQQGQQNMMHAQERMQMIRITQLALVVLAFCSFAAAGILMAEGQILSFGDRMMCSLALTSGVLGAGLLALSIQREWEKGGIKKKCETENERFTELTQEIADQLIDQEDADETVLQSAFEIASAEKLDATRMGSQALFLRWKEMDLGTLTDEQKLTLTKQGVALPFEEYREEWPYDAVLTNLADLDLYFRLVNEKGYRSAESNLLHDEYIEGVTKKGTEFAIWALTSHRWECQHFLDTRYEKMTSQEKKAAQEEVKRRITITGEQVELGRDILAHYEGLDNLPRMLKESLN